MVLFGKYRFVEPRDMDVSENGGFSPKSSIFIGSSIIIHHPFWGVSLFFGVPPVSTFEK